MLSVRRGRDCATRERRIYTIERGWELDDAEFLEGAEVEVHAFSSYVANARDYVRLRLGPAVEVSYGVGDPDMVIAYGRLGASAPPALIEGVEAKLFRFLRGRTAGMSPSSG